MTTREYIYIPARTPDEQAANPRYDPISMERKPDRLWSLAVGRHDPDAVIDPEMPLIHGQTAWVEDVGHDWRWRDGQLFYHPGGERDGGLWLALVFAEMP
jgi:hypothetical protein